METEYKERLVRRLSDTRGFFILARDKHNPCLFYNNPDKIVAISKPDKKETHLNVLLVDGDDSNIFMFDKNEDVIPVQIASISNWKMDYNTNEKKNIADVKGFFVTESVDIRRPIFYYNNPDILIGEILESGIVTNHNDRLCILCLNDGGTNWFPIDEKVIPVEIEGICTTNIITYEY